MKIAVFHELDNGGARKAVNEFSIQLKKNNLVDLYTVVDQLSDQEKECFTNVYTYPLYAKKWNGGNWKVKLYKDSFELYKLYKLHKRIAEEITKKNYDIVLINPSQYTQAPFILRFIKIPKIYYCMEPLRLVYDSLIEFKKELSISRYYYEKINRMIRKYIDKKNVSYATVCVAPSKFLAKLFAQVYKKHVDYVYCGVNTRRFAPKKKSKKFDLLYIGSRTIENGYDTLQETIRYMRNKPRTRIILSEEEWIEDENEVRDIYLQTKVVVCTARKEGLGLVALEAMSCGIPVVAVNEGGHKETVIDGQTGYLVPRNPKDIAKKLDSLLENDKLLSEFALSARKHIVEKWSWEKCAQQLESILSRNCKKPL